jgi:geranylgeranyl reductase family protein
MIARSSPPSADAGIVVVGAGPAGATAARRLATAGVRVRLLDRKAFPRNKPCGGGISIRVLRRFPYLREPLARIATLALSRLYLEGPEGESTIVESARPAALMVRRVEFDALLVSLACEAGAELVTGADVVHADADDRHVTLRTRDGRRFDADVVIAADGVNSTIARRLGLNPGWPASSIALDMMEETPRAHLRDLDPSTMWVAYGYRPADGAAGENGRGVAHGYAYIFPKRDHVNIGIGYVLSHYRREIDQPPYDLQRGFVDRLRNRGIVEGQSMRRHFTPSLIPVGGPLRRPGGGRVLVAGDAGGFVNAFTAEGIYYGMVSGDCAARAVLVSGGQPAGLADRYRRACDYEIGAELRDSVTLQRYLFADRRRISAIVRGAGREPALTRLVLSLATGERSYRDVRRRLLARKPALAATFLWERVGQKL